MAPILISSSAKRITTRILVNPELNGKKDLVFRVCCVYDMIFPSKQLPFQI